MTLPVVIRQESEEDLLLTCDWYDRQSAALGKIFTAQFAAVLEQVAATPELFAIQWNNVRSCQLRRFPYILDYRLLTDRTEVLAVLHSSRDPAAWRTRV